ncbi:MAG: cyclase family protein [Vicinamibacterales bacterium]
MSDDAKRLHNWGRWGSADEIGTANYITPETIVAAAQLVRRGAVFSCAIPLDEKGPVYPGRQPPKHLMTLSGADYHAGLRSMGAEGIKFADDYLFAALQCSTQWDALSHAWYGNQLYNGFAETEVRGTGARKLGIEKLHRHFVGRGVLLDLPRAINGGERLQPGYAVTADDLDRAVTHAATDVRRGDILLIRTGHLPWYYTLKNKAEFWKAAPGLGKATVPWLHAHEVAAVAVDNITVEVQPAEDPANHLPLHGALLRDLGMTLGEMFDLDPLAADCAADGVYQCLFVAQPLRIPGAVGSPINPLAIK